MGEKTCHFCGQKIEEKTSMVDVEGHAHPKCWRAWAIVSPQYQKDLAEYKAKGEHVDYYMLDPDDINDEGHVVRSS
jgi:hypothetical protein